MMFMSVITSLRAGLRRALGLKFRSTYVGISGSSYAGKSVNVNNTLQLDACWACTRLISDLISTLPLTIYKRSVKSRQIASSHVISKLLTEQPNADMTPAEFWATKIVSLLLWGNAYSLKVKGTNGELIALEPLKAERVRHVIDEVGNLIFKYVDDRGVQHDYTEFDIWHIKGFSIDGRVGLSVIQYARHTLGMAIAQEEVAGRVFQQGLRPSGVVSTDQILTKTQRQEIRESVISQISEAAAAGRNVVLEAGMKYQAIEMKPEDAQLLQSRSFSIEQICRWFYNVPPIMIGHSPQGHTMWGSGVEQVMMAWRTTGLNPLIIKIEQSIQGLFELSDKGSYFAKFNLNGLLRPDSAGRAALYSSAVQNGWMSRNEVRALEDVEPYSGGDVFTVQSNLLPLDILGKNYAVKK